MGELTLEHIHKARLIQQINDMLLKYDQEPLITEDFDKLVDLDVEQLTQAKFNIKDQLKHISPKPRQLRVK